MMEGTPPRGRPSATPTTSNAPTHQRTSHGTSAPHPLLLGTATQQWRNPRPHAKQAPNLRRWTRHTRSSGHWDSEKAKETPHKGTRARTPTWRQYRSPPREARPRNPRRRRAACPPSAPRGNGATAPAKAGARKKHPQPGPDDGALPEVRPAAACAAIRYRVVQGWILDETARGSVNIQEAVDRVTHAGQAAVALHNPGPPRRTRKGDHCGTLGNGAGPGGGHGPRGAPRIPCAAGMPTVDHPCVHRPRAWPFSTWAVLAVMWHLAPEDAPTWTAEEIARDLHTWPADQDYPWRRPRGGLPVTPAAEGLSLAATLQRHPDKRARHFQQTGTVPAAPPDSEWRWDAGQAQPLPGPWVLPLWYLPMGTLAHATQAVKGAFPQPLLPGVALLRSLQAGAA